MKQCTLCGEMKSYSEFYRMAKQKTGLHPRCKPCVNAFNRAYHHANKERMQEWKRRSALRRWAKKILNLDHVHYEALLARAAGRCEVCGRPESTTSTNGHSFMLAIDHDHVTMQVRGMLCRACNSALGHAYDSPTLLRKLADYLEDPPGIPNPAQMIEAIERRRAVDMFGSTKRPRTNWRHSPETRAKLAASAVGNQRTAGLKHPPRSPEWLAKQSEAQKRAWERRKANALT